MSGNLDREHPAVVVAASANAAADGIAAALEHVGLTCDTGFIVICAARPQGSDDAPYLAVCARGKLPSDVFERAAAAVESFHEEEVRARAAAEGAD